MTTAQEESQLAWSPEQQGHRLCLETRREPTSLRMGLGDVCRTAADVFEKRAVDYSPLYSRDGKSIAFVRDGRHIMAVDRKSQENPSHCQSPF